MQREKSLLTPTRLNLWENYEPYGTNPNSHRAPDLLILPHSADLASSPERVDEERILNSH